jgi:hypothetical protein
MEIHQVSEKANRSWYPPFKERFFMSAQEDRQLKALALLELVESRQRKNLIWEKAARLGEHLHGLADLLKMQPDNIAAESYTDALNHESLVELVADAKQAIAGVQAAEEKARRLGVLEGLTDAA